MKPQFIDANKITLTGSEMFNDGEEILVPLSDVRKALQMTPKADVVPRSTINEIFALIWDAFQSAHDDIEFEEKFDKIEKKYTEESP